MHMGSNDMKNAKKTKNTERHRKMDKSGQKRKNEKTRFFFHLMGSMDGQ